MRRAVKPPKPTKPPKPSPTPTVVPTVAPTVVPTVEPTVIPTVVPTSTPQPGAGSQGDFAYAYSEQNTCFGLAGWLAGQEAFIFQPLQ